MIKYSTNIAKSELNNEWAQNPLVYSLTPFTSFRDFGSDLINIFVLPCKLMLLSVGSLIESVSYLIRGFYYYCISLNDLALQNTVDCMDCAYTALKTLGLLLSSLLYAIVFLSRLFSTFFQWISSRHNGYIEITNVVPTQSLNQNNKVVTDALEEYVEFLRKVGADKEVIETVLREQDSDISVLEEQVALEKTKMRSSVTVAGMTHFQNPPNTNKKPRSSRYSELLREYKELFNTYPVLGLERLTTDEAHTRLTLQLIEQAHANCEEHHAKFLEIAEELLSESGALIQRVKDIFREFKVLERSTTMTRK